MKNKIIWIFALIFVLYSLNAFAIINTTFGGGSSPSTNPSDWFSQAGSNQLGKVGCGYLTNTSTSVIARCNNGSLFKNYSTDTKMRVDFSANQINTSSTASGGGGGGENALRVYTGNISPLLGKGYCVDFKVTPIDVDGLNYFIGFSKTLNAVTASGDITGFGSNGGANWILWNGATSVGTGQSIILNQKFNMTLCANETTILSTVYFNNSNAVSSTQALGAVVDPANLTIYVQTGGGSTGNELIVWEDIFVYNFTGAPQATSTPADTTPPVINITNLNASDTIRINNVLNISAFITGSPTLVNFTFNLTGNEDLYNFSYSVSGANVWTSQNITINVTRGNVINASVVACDSSNNCAINSTIITIGNTNTTATLIINATDKNFNTNLTLNITKATDNDNDTINYIIRFESSNPPTVIILNSTGLNFTTNFTNESFYFVRIDTTDGYDTTIGTSIFNVTLDTTTPLWQEAFVNNGSFYRISTNITYNCTDKNIFEINTTFARNTGAIINTINYTNLTNSGGSKIINLSIDVSAGDNLYNITRWCGDSKNKGRSMSKWQVSKTTDNRTLQVNYTQDNLQCNITYGTENPAGNWLPLTASTSVKMNLKYTNDDYYKITYDVVVPNDNFISSTKFECNQKVTQISDNLAGHMHIGNGREKLSYDAQDLLDNGFIIVTKAEGNIYYQKATKGGIVNGAVINYDPRLDNLNFVENSAIIEIDTGQPIFNYFNISINNTIYGNNSFIRSNILNISFNVSDKNNNSVVVYIGNTGGGNPGVLLRNVTIGYQSNITKNITINRIEDRNYTMLIQINDSAGNFINGSYLFGFAIDNTPPTDINVSNKTITGATTITTNTAVNISVYIQDLYLNAGNLSENCTSSVRAWRNQSITPSTINTTYSIILNNGNFSSGQVCGWKYYFYDLAGNVLDPVNTFTIGDVASSSGSTDNTANTGGGGGGLTGAVRKCYDYAQTFKQCYYFDGVNKCLKGCKNGQICNAQYECIGNITSTTLAIKEPLFNIPTNQILSPLQKFLNWFKNLLSLSKKTPELSIIKNTEKSIEPMKQQRTQQPTIKESIIKTKEQTKVILNQHKWLPYVIVGIVIAGVGIYVFGLWQPILAFVMGFGIWGYIILLIVATILFNLVRWFK